jgi:hypothetical protein
MLAESKELSLAFFIHGDSYLAITPITFTGTTKLLGTFPIMIGPLFIEEQPVNSPSMHLAILQL